jgi:hypothetical protein
MRPGQSTGCSRSQEVGNATTASAIETFSGRHLSGFVCHRRMQPYSSPPDRLKNTLPHVGPTTSLRTVILRGDRGLAHTVAMIEVTCDVSFGSRLCENSDAQLACRTSISISSMWESIVLATSFGRRQLRKQSCASFAQARFHTAWVIRDRAEPAASLAMSAAL